MADYGALKARVQELSERAWDVQAIEARIKKLSKEGYPRRDSTGMKLLPTRSRSSIAFSSGPKNITLFLRIVPRVPLSP